ncbi:MAG: ABC transporter permease [bacterium]|nr:ABC transporter permease [bacterium]
MDAAAWVLLPLTLSKMAPLLLAGLGGLASERTGVINIALEGMMLAGAFCAAAGGIATGSAWVGLVCGALGGGLLAGVHALACIRLRMDQIVSGTAVNLLALGGTGFFLFRFFGVHGSSPPAPKLPMLDLFLEGGLRQPVTVPLALGMAVLAWFVLYRTPYGLWVRATGESPETARASGIRVQRVQAVGVLISGLLAGLGGAHLALGDLSQFVERMVAGRGFIALAALIFGKWHPLGVLGACLFFGFAEAVADGLQGWTAQVPSQVFLGLPFVLTMVVLAGFVGRSRAPGGLGRVE